VSLFARKNLRMSLSERTSLTFKKYLDKRSLEDYCICYNRVYRVYYPLLPPLRYTNYPSPTPHMRSQTIPVTIGGVQI
jgi:hypothetical protein